MFLMILETFDYSSTNSVYISSVITKRDYVIQRFACKLYLYMHNSTFFFSHTEFPISTNNYFYSYSINTFINFFNK